MTTTYGYVSLIRASMDNPEWGDEEGDRSVIAGKVDDVYMPKIKSDDGDSIVARRYEREALVELPRRMTADDAFEWARDGPTEELEEFYGGAEA